MSSNEMPEFRRPKGKSVIESNSADPTCIMFGKQPEATHVWLNELQEFPTCPSEVSDIARIAHTVNKAYCAFLGDHSQPDWDKAPPWQRESAEQGVRFVMFNPNAGPSAQHDNWMAQKLADGWVYGPEKDPEAKTHPCLVPFEQLPKEQQAKDILFRAVVEGFLSNSPNACGEGAQP